MKIMKLNKLDTHDRLEYFTKQSFNIAECCQDIIDKRPFGEVPFYIFAHTRTDDNNAGIKRLIWQPRLTKPTAQTNSMLFKVYPGTDNVKIIWMIPAKELWPQFEKGLMMQNKTVLNSINAYKNNREALEEPEADDLNDEQINDIYKNIRISAKAKNAFKKISELSEM